MAEKTKDIVLQQENDGPSLQEILIPIWANRKKILIISVGVALLTLGINFLLPVYYKSTATLLPETQKDKLSALGQFADIANLAGVSVPGSEIARLYPTIVMSETVLRGVLQQKFKTERYPEPVGLIEYFELETGTPREIAEKGLSTLRGLLSASHDTKTSVVSLSLEMPEPQLAADVLNAIVFELDQFMRFKRSNNASEQVRWIEVRLKEVEQELRIAEDSLRSFRERNRRVIDSPQLLLEQERLGRAVQVKSTIYVELKKQFELAKLEEIKNISIVNVLDSANAPVKKVRPKRATNAGIMFLVSLAGLSGYVISRTLYRDKIDGFFGAFRTGRPRERL